METEQEDTEPELSPERQKVIALFDPPTIELTASEIQSKLGMSNATPMLKRMLKDNLLEQPKSRGPYCLVTENDQNSQDIVPF